MIESIAKTGCQGVKSRVRAPRPRAGRSWGGVLLDLFGPALDLWGGYVGIAQRPRTLTSTRTLGAVHADEISADRAAGHAPIRTARGGPFVTLAEEGRLWPDSSFAAKNPPPPHPHCPKPVLQLAQILPKRWRNQLIRPRHCEMWRRVHPQLFLLAAGRRRPGAGDAPAPCSVDPHGGRPPRR